MLIRSIIGSSIRRAACSWARNALATPDGERFLAAMSRRCEEVNSGGAEEYGRRLAYCRALHQVAVQLRQRIDELDQLKAMVAGELMKEMNRIGNGEKTGDGKGGGREEWQKGRTWNEGWKEGKKRWWRWRMWGCSEKVTRGVEADGRT